MNSWPFCRCSGFDERKDVMLSPVRGLVLVRSGREQGRWREKGSTDGEAHGRSFLAQAQCLGWSLGDGGDGDPSFRKAAPRKQPAEARRRNDVAQGIIARVPVPPMMVEPSAEHVAEWCSCMLSHDLETSLS